MQFFNSVNMQCPEVQLMDNPDVWGKFQTMRSLAAFHVEVRINKMCVAISLIY